MRDRLAAALLLMLAGCGPSVLPQDATGSTATSTGNSTGPTTVVATSALGTTLDTTSTVATSAPPTPETTSGSSSTGDVGLERCPCSFLCPLCSEKGCSGYDLWCNETFECNVLAQDCADGEKCMPWANDGESVWNATRCTPSAPEPDQIGEPCVVEGWAGSGIDSCDVSQMCFDVDPEDNTGTCVGFCAGSREDVICPDGQTCSISNDGVLALCLPSCDPLGPTCGDGDGCFPSGSESFVCLPGPSESIASTFTCYLSGGCEPGTLCLDSLMVPDCDDDGGCCSPYCDRTAPACPPNTECLPFFEKGALPQFEDVGVCGVPT